MRYLPLTDADRSAMLDIVGTPSIEALFADVPEEARLAGPIKGLQNHASEMAVERHMASLAAKNLAAGSAPFFLGAGAYRHHVPASVDHLIQRGEFLTSYTPYQPEIAQGTLQVLFEFQTQVARLYGCEVANASMYDGSTACWEAISMARRITRRVKSILSAGLHPHYASVVETLARFTEDEVSYALPDLSPTSDIAALAAAIDEQTSCVVVQYPDILGRVEDLAPLAEAAHAKGALLVVVVTEPVALGAVRSPGEMGADIVVGEGQALGRGAGVGVVGCGQRPQALLAEQRHMDRERQRAEAGIGADVARRFLAAEVLLARREREDEAAPALGIDGLSAQAAGHLPHELLARREEADVRPAELQPHSERLAFADHNVGAHLAR